MSVYYSGYTRQPSIYDLLSVPDYTNPLNITMGNPGLKPAFGQSISVNYRGGNMEKQEMLYCGLRYNNTINDISRKRTYDEKSGVYTSRPENINGNWGIGGNIYYTNKLFKKIFARLATNANYNRRVSYVQIMGEANENDRNTSQMLSLMQDVEFAYKLEDMEEFVNKVGYPVLVRPSYVLSGAAMNVCYNEDELKEFLQMAKEVSKEYPVVVSQFMQDTKEIEFDAVAQNGEVVEYAISEHIEYAGVHSGDATLVFPAQKIYFETARRIKKIGRRIAKELNISGPFNMQFLAKNNEVKVIECNLRASCSFPFVSKVLKRNFIETATRIMLGAPYSQPDKSAFDIDWIGVKASQFSFSRLHKADPVLGVDMSSTGEVGCS
jgi:carbamoylphosphate synthase large subunit